MAEQEDSNCKKKELEDLEERTSLLASVVGEIVAASEVETAVVEVEDEEEVPVLVEVDVLVLDEVVVSSSVVVCPAVVPVAEISK